MGNLASILGVFIILIFNKPLKENNATNCVDLRIKNAAKIILQHKQSFQLNKNVMISGKKILPLKKEMPCSKASLLYIWKKNEKIFVGYVLMLPGPAAGRRILFPALHRSGYNRSYRHH